jgi:hypothetical protein
MTFFLPLIAMLTSATIALAEPLPDSGTRPASGPSTRPDDVLAIVCDIHIRRSEIERGPEQYAKEHQYRLLGRILQAALYDYRIAHRIEATDAEIVDFCDAMNELQKTHPSPAGESTHYEPNKFREVHEGFVLTWKISKALYEQYGGTVIFNQGNPREPIGAYRRLLVEMQANGRVKMLDAAYIERFGESFERALPDDQGPWVVKPDRIDFSKPWWRQAPDK